MKITVCNFNQISDISYIFPVIKGQIGNTLKKSTFKFWSNFENFSLLDTLWKSLPAFFNQISDISYTFSSYQGLKGLYSKKSTFYYWSDLEIVFYLIPNENHCLHFQSNFRQLLQFSNYMGSKGLHPLKNHLFIFGPISKKHF